MIKFKRLKKNAETNINTVTLQQGQPLVDFNTCKLYIGSSDDDSAETADKLSYYDSKYVDTQLINNLKVDNSSIVPNNGSVTLCAGSNVTLTHTDNSVTINSSYENTTYSSGTGISITDANVINHSNSITAGTAQGSTTKTLTFGGTFTIPTVTYDAQGHITSTGTTTMTMPPKPTDTNTWRSIAVDGTRLLDTSTDNASLNFKAGNNITLIGNDHTITINAKNTYYNSYLYVGAQNTAGNSQTSNGSTYLKLYDDSTKRSEYKISGSGATTVTSDASGNITISSSNTTYNFSASNPTLSWGSTSTIGTAGGVTYNVTMPSNPLSAYTFTQAY